MANGGGNLMDVGNQLPNIVAPGLRLPDKALDPTLDYISGPGLNTISPYLMQLPLPDDDLDGLLGCDTYRRIGFDPQVASSEMLLETMVLRSGAELIGDVQDDRDGAGKFADSERYLAFCQDAVDNMERRHGSLYKSLFEQLRNAIAYGHSLSEPTLEWGEGKYAEKKLLRSIKAKDRRSYAFVIDAYWNLVGVATYVGPYQEWINEMSSLIQEGPFIPSEALQPTQNKDGEWLWGWELIERDKIWVTTLLGENNDPRGRSWRRAIYNNWYAKMKLLGYLDAYAMRFGIPWAFGTTAQGQPDQAPPDPITGKPDLTKPTVSAQTAMLATVQGMMGGSSAALPFGASITITQPTNDGGSLLAMMNYHDSAINQGITGQSLANKTAPHQAKAAGEVHQDSLNNPIFYLKEMLESSFRSDVLMPLIEKNFGKAAVKYTPHLNLGKITPEDFARYLEAMGKANSYGMLDDSMLPGLWDWFGFPKVDKKAWWARIKANAALLDAAASAATLPGTAQGSRAADQGSGNAGATSAASGAQSDLAREMVLAVTKVATRKNAVKAVSEQEDTL